jgi:hypothetical protein
LAATAAALDREAFTFTKYDLEVRIEPEQRRLRVRGKITVRNDSAVPQKSLALQISSTLDWRSIQIAGKMPEFVTQPYASDLDHTGSLTEAIITLPQEIPPKGSVEIEVGYEGLIFADATRLMRVGVPEAMAKQLSWDGIAKSFSAVRGVGYVSWYPMAMNAASLSDGNSVAETTDRWKKKEASAEMKVSLTLIANDPQSDVELICNGGGSTVHEQSKQAERVKAECNFAPVGLEVPWFVAADYESLEKPYITIRYLPADKTGAESYALEAGLAAGLVTDWFGAQREKAEVVELADAGSAPYESGTWFLTPLAGEDTREYRQAAVYQMARAAVVSPRAWIADGLGHFAQALDREQQDGRPGAIQFLGSHLGGLIDAEKASAKGGEALAETSREEFYRSKAMFVWWMLRDTIGDEALKKALASYKADQDRDPSYMPKLIEAQTQKDLQWFFDDWALNDRGLPDFRVTQAPVQPSATNTFLTTITIENLGAAGAEVPVSVRMKSGEVMKRLTVHAKAKGSIRIETPSAPAEVVVNDGSVPESDTENNSYKISDNK